MGLHEQEEIYLWGKGSGGRQREGEKERALKSLSPSPTVIWLSNDLGLLPSLGKKSDLLMVFKKGQLLEPD